MSLKDIANKFINDVTWSVTDVAILGTASTPEITGLYILSKALLGTALELRKERGRKFIEFANSHISNDSAVLENQQVQDGFVFSFQKYIFERSEYKRQVILSILLGFIGNEDREKFELEKLNNVLSLVSVEDIEVVKIWTDGTLLTWFHCEWLKAGAVGSPSGQQMIDDGYGLALPSYAEVLKSIGLTKLGDLGYLSEKLDYLVGVGLLTEQIRYKSEGFIKNGEYRVSKFGKEFVKYIHKDWV